MAAPTAGASALEATYKVAEAEGVLDRYFYRRIGFWLAHRFAKVGVTPVAVTLIGGFFGIIAGHLYFYRDLRTNIAGMALHVFANALDNADGQLARLTNRQSRMGRVIDSLADHLIWLSIYFHLALRCDLAGSPLGVVLLALAAGLSHAAQGAAADYFRNGYLYFVKGRARADLDSSADLRREFRHLRWRDQPWHKFLLALYLNFTAQQEILVPGLQRLHQAIERVCADEIPQWLQSDYRTLARPMFKWWGFLMTNTRMILLFFLLFIDRPVWFFWAELTVFNILLISLMLQQARMCSALLKTVPTAGEAAIIGG